MSKMMKKRRLAGGLGAAVACVGVACAQRPSATAITPFYYQLTVAGAAEAGMNRLREIGLEAEHAMLAATDGVDTHRGAIFSLGLLCAAAGATWSATTRSESHWQAKVLGTTVHQR
jgi:triphosphoribosyl-dephospho-CoA synthase